MIVFTPIGSRSILLLMMMKRKVQFTLLISKKIKSKKLILKEFKHALVWGTSAKHNPQIVGRDHILDDEDVVQVVKNN